MELLNSIFHFFTDKTKKLPHKVILFLLAIVLIAIFDNFLSFTYSYNNGKKIEQIDGINKILNDTSLTKYEKNKLMLLRNNIINHNTWKDKAYDFLTSIEFKNDERINNKKKSINSKPIKKQTEAKPSKQKKRDYFRHFISSSWLFIFLMIVFPFIGFFDKKTPFIQAVGIIIIVEPIFYGICWIYAKMFSFIPIIFNEPTYNYILNAILCLLSVLLFSLLDNKNK